MEGPGGRLRGDRNNLTGELINKQQQKRPAEAASNAI
jgi:hypothetical protein